LGTDITDGIAEGVRAGESNATGAMEEVVDAMLAAAKVAAGIQSPSRRSRDEVGIPMAEGVLDGIANMSDAEILSAWDDFISANMSAASISISASDNTLASSLSEALESVASFDADEVWETVRTNLADAYTALNDEPKFSAKISSNEKWLDFVDDLGYKEYWEQAWDEIVGTLSLDTPMSEVYSLILDKTKELAGNSWSGAFQAVTDYLEPVLAELISGVADQTLAEYANLTDEQAETMFSVGSTLSGIANAATTRWQDYGSSETWNRIRELEQERALLQDTAAIDAEIAAERANIAETEQTILDLQQAQSDLDYLQSQFDLLQLISDYGLDASTILDGISLGVDADAGAILEATTAAMEAIVAQLSASLTASTASTTSAVSASTVSAGATSVSNAATFGPIYITSGTDLATLEALFTQWTAGMIN
jgi:hypothetical protein